MGKNALAANRAAMLRGESLISGVGVPPAWAVRQGMLCDPIVAVARRKELTGWGCAVSNPSRGRFRIFA